MKSKKTAVFYIFLIYLLIHNIQKTWGTTFWQRLHRWQQSSQIWKERMLFIYGAFAFVISFRFFSTSHLSTSRQGCTNNMEEVLIKPVWKGESGFFPSLFHSGQSYSRFIYLEDRHEMQWRQKSFHAGMYWWIILILVFFVCVLTNFTGNWIHI